MVVSTHANSLTQSLLLLHGFEAQDILLEPIRVFLYIRPVTCEQILILPWMWKESLSRRPARTIVYRIGTSDKSFILVLDMQLS